MLWVVTSNHTPKARATAFPFTLLKRRKITAKYAVIKCYNCRIAHYPAVKQYAMDSPTNKLA